MVRGQIYSVVILFYLFSNFSFSQKINIPDNFKKYTSQDGLSSPLIRAITQDKNGYIWIGTEDGLNKFDGYNFVSYGLDISDPNSLPDNIITCLSPSSNGGVHIGTLNGGFATYNPDEDNFTAYSAIYGQSGALQHNSIGPVFEDSKGNLWIGSMGGSLYLRSAGVDTLKLYEHIPGDQNTLGNNIVVDILEDQNENIWVRTNAGLSKIDIDTKSITNYNIPRPIIEFHLRYTQDMIIDKNGIIWMGWNSEIVKFNTKTTNIEYLVPQGLTREFGFVSSICEHDDNHLWIGSYSAIYLYNKKTNTAHPFYHDPLRLESLPFSNNEALFKDNTGVLWCSGLAKLNLINKNIQQITNQSVGMTVQENFIRSLFVDSKGKYWVSTNMGIDIIDPEAKTTVSYQPIPNDPDYFLNGFTSVFQEDNQGNIWIGQWGLGIVVLREGDPNDFFKINSQPGVSDALQNGNIQAILHDKYGNAWIGLDNGICIMDTKTLKAKTYLNKMDDANSPTPFSVEPRSMAQDDYENVWFGTWGGLTQAKLLNPEQGIMNSEVQFTQFMVDPGNNNAISDNRTVSLLYDNTYYPNIIFSGTYGGGINMIYLNNKGEFDSLRYITTNEGLPNNTIFGMLTDNSGDIWVSTNHGICQFNPIKNEFHAYDKNDGFQDDNFLRSAYAKDDKNMLFGGANGFNVFNPADLGVNNTPPMLVFTSLEVDGKKVEVGQKVNKRVILNTNINKIPKLVITHKEKSFTITFAALHYAFPKNNQYKYMLESFDENWLTADANVRRASYSNLKPGNYVLKVIASNSDEVPMKEPRFINITVKPPWWNTILFYIIVIVIVSFTIRQIIISREKRVKRDKQILEEKLKKGEQEIENQKKEVIEKSEELNRRDIAEKEQKWFNQGMIKLGDIITKHKNNAEELSSHFLTGLIQFLNAKQGAIYILNDNDESDKYLELAAGYGLPKERLSEKRIDIGVSLVGTCYKEIEKKILNDIPDAYTKISSGIGSAVPKLIVLIPLKTDEANMGVIELSLLNNIEDHQIRFIEQIGEMFASNIYTSKTAQKVELLLEQSQMQSEEMRAQEEEMRQNMEEMQATSEESARREEELHKLNEEVLKKERKLLKKIKDKDEALKKAHEIIQRGSNK